MSEDWTPRTDGQLDDKITECVENLAEAIADHWGSQTTRLEIAVTKKVYRMRVSIETYGLPGRRQIERIVDRQCGRAMRIDPLAAAIETMCREIESMGKQA